MGLIAYGLYKRRKSELAEGYRKNKLAEDEITRRLKTFHDQEVQGNGALDGYRSSAERLLNDMLTKTYENAKREAIDCMLAEANSRKSSDTSVWKKVCTWLLSSIPGALATFVVGLLILLLAAFFMPEHTKQSAIASLASTISGVSLVPKDAPPAK